MVGSPTAIGSDGDTQDHGDGPFAVGKVATATHFGKELVEARPDVIGKLYLHDGFQPYGTHAYRGSYNEGLLYGGVEYTVVAKLLGQGSRFAEYAAQASPHVLSVQEALRMLFHELFNGE